MYSGQYTTRDFVQVRKNQVNGGSKEHHEPKSRDEKTNGNSASDDKQVDVNRVAHNVYDVSTDIVRHHIYIEKNI